MARSQAALLHLGSTPESVVRGFCPAAPWAHSTPRRRDMSSASFRLVMALPLLPAACHREAARRGLAQCATFQQMTAPIATLSDSAHGLYLYAKPALFDSIRPRVQASLQALMRRTSDSTPEGALVVFGRIRDKGIAEPVWLRNVRLVDDAFEGCVVPVPVAIAPWIPPDRVRMQPGDVMDWQALAGDSVAGAFAVRAYLAALPATWRKRKAADLLGGRPLSSSAQ